MWEMLLYVLLPTNASRMKNEINPCNYMRKSNQQPYSLAANSKRLSVDGKVSDSSSWLMLMHYGETGIFSHQEVSDSSVWLMPTHFILKLQKTRYQGSQHTSKWELGCAKLEIPVPLRLRALLFHHPQRIQNIVSMAPWAKRRSLCKQQLDRIFRAVVIGHNEPSTQNRGAAIDPTKAMKQNVHGLVFVDGNDWLLPQLEAYAFPVGEAFLLQCFVPFRVAARLLHCDVIQLTMNMNYIVLTELILPIRWSSMYIHFSLTHGNNHCHRHAEIFFDDIQVASGLQAAKRHSCPFCRLANKATIHRPRSYGWEAVIVLLDDFIQGRPWNSVIVRILDVFLPGLRPLQHLTSRHGWAYLRTLVSFTWEKSCQIVKWTCIGAVGARTCARIQAVERSTWKRQDKAVESGNANSHQYKNKETTLMNIQTWQHLCCKWSFGQLRYEAQICCHAWKLRQFWLLYMPNLKNQIIRRKPQTVLVCSLVKLRQIWLLYMPCFKNQWILPVSYMLIINSRGLAIKLSGIAPLARFHFGGCFYNEIRSRAFFGGAHLQSTDATSPCFHCIHLLIGGQLEDLLSDHSHVGTLIVCGNLSHQQMHFVICHVEIARLFRWQKASTENGLGFFAATAMTLVCCIMNTSSSPVPDFLMVGSSSSARTSTLMYLGKMGASCNFTPKPEKSKSSYGQAMGYTIPTALWFSERRILRTIGRFWSLYALYNAGCAATTWNWHSGNCTVAVSLSCVCNTPEAAAGTLDREVPALRLFVASLASTGCLKQIPAGPRFCRSVRSCSLEATVATAWRFCSSIRILSISPVWSARFTVAKIAISSSHSVWQLCVSCRLQCPVSASIFVRQFLQATYIGLPKRLLYTDVLHKEASTHRSFYMQTLLHIDVFKHRRFYTQTLLQTDAFTQTPSHPETFTHRRFYTQTLLHTDAFTHRHFYTNTFTCKDDTFTHRGFYTQKLLHADPFTHRRFYKQMLLHTHTPSHPETFTQRRLYTQTLLHKHIHTQRLLLRSFCTQTLLHTEVFTQRNFYTQTLLHTNTFTHRRFYNLHTNTFTHRDRNCEIAILPQFLAIEPHFGRNLISGERVAIGRQTSQFYLEPHFVRKGCDWTPRNRNFTSVFGDRTSCRAKGLRGTSWNRNLTSVFDDRTSFRAKGLRRTSWNRNFTSVFGARTSFRAKRLRREPGNRNFTSAFGDRTSFRAKRFAGNTKSQFYLSFWRSNLISCERVAPEA